MDIDTHVAEHAVPYFAVLQKKWSAIVCCKMEAIVCENLVTLGVILLIKLT